MHSLQHSIPGCLPACLPACLQHRVEPADIFVRYSIAIIILYRLKTPSTPSVRPSVCVSVSRRRRRISYSLARRCRRRRSLQQLRNNNGHPDAVRTDSSYFLDRPDQKKERRRRFLCKVARSSTTYGARLTGLERCCMPATCQMSKTKSCLSA